MPFSWVLCDEAFGGSHEFLGHLEQAGLQYLADVPVSTLVWQERPLTEVPVAKTRGRPPSRERVVFRQSLGDPAERKVFLSNAAGDTPHAELMRQSGLRWPIESCFEEAKSNLGMAQYQTRSWRGWHHHMTLVILAHHFLVRVQLQHKKGPRR